jgi:hypothetical protein
VCGWTCSRSTNRGAVGAAWDGRALTLISLSDVDHADRAERGCGEARLNRRGASSASRVLARGRGEAIRDSSLDARRAGLEVNRSCLKSASVWQTPSAARAGAAASSFRPSPPKSSPLSRSLSFALSQGRSLAGLGATLINKSCAYSHRDRHARSQPRTCRKFHRHSTSFPARRSNGPL